MRHTRTLMAIFAAVLMMAAAGNRAAAEHATYGPAYPSQVVAGKDLNRWFAARKIALIDTRNARRREIKDAYLCALRGSYGYQRKHVVDKYRYDLAVVNNWFRRELNALQGTVRSKVAYGAPVTVGVDPYLTAPCSTGAYNATPGPACTRYKCDKRRKGIVGPACRAGTCDLPPVTIPDPAGDVIPVPDVPSAEPILAPPAIPPGEYGGQPMAYNNGWLARVIALRDLLSELF